MAHYELDALVDEYKDALESLPEPRERDEADWAAFNIWSEVISDLERIVNNR